MSETPAPRRSRRRLFALLALLAATVLFATITVVRVFTPPPPQPDFYPPDPLARDVAAAKKLPEFAELNANLNRPATPAEFARALELSKHPNAYVRMLARGRLTKVKDGPNRAEAVATVAEGLRDEHSALQLGAAYNLVSMRATEYEPAIRALADAADEHLRSAYLHALERMPQPPR